ncbi:WxcM-like domain-containing protein [Pedobacter sp. Leaf194]|uniref:WxcM-like domain-containing protein n=1 Tax=Pedobacter sp. Leaf194 TaxID=1736297 RepID=UPI000703BC01|nr:WxcM-like domain-containing protein [Pedobacter sp. Leaf194]KQS37797.1 hypothetical protein ASG14_19790 [Pedobacter sp. Leaf194]
MGNQVDCIKGGTHSDHRGTLSFVNDFDMSQVKRFYRIRHNDTAFIRGWRAHRIEQRWFHVIEGGFKINLVQIDDWTKPSPALSQQEFVLQAADNVVLHVPKGYASAICAIKADSEVMVFADYSIEHAKNDDILFPIDYFKA